MKKIIVLVLLLSVAAFAATTEKRHIILEQNNMYAYKNKNICWVIDYKLHKTNLVDCSIIDVRRELEIKKLIPPFMPGIPSALFQGLFK